MKVKEFLTILRQNKDKALLFEYKQDKFVRANYHITEVKNISVQSVDCGGRSDKWNETVIQLWESPSEIGKTDFMKVNKALSIIEKVDSIHPILLETEVKLEYGNAEFHTATLDIDNINLMSDRIIVQLFVTETDCKAKDICIVPEKEIVTAEEVCCSGSGCC